jgi:hypothetical protein
VWPRSEYCHSPCELIKHQAQVGHQTGKPSAPDHLVGVSDKALNVENASTRHMAVASRPQQHRLFGRSAIGPPIRSGLPHIRHAAPPAHARSRLYATGKNEKPQGPHMNNPRPAGVVRVYWYIHLSLSSATLSSRFGIDW